MDEIKKTTDNELPQNKVKSVEPITVTGIRDQRFGEVFIVTPNGIEVYNSTGLNDCPAELWDVMDVGKIKEQFEALAVQKNGPHFWMMDEQTLYLGETATFGGIDARWAATLDPAILQKSAKGSQPYTVFMPKKTQKQVFYKGKAVFELVDPEGNVYVLQSRNEEFNMEALATLGEKMTQLPKGWIYRTRILKKQLVLDLSPANTIYAVGDEFHQYYTRIPKK